MLLSKLEIKGFKSFGDRMVINFDKGITGVVGPNGCGKSNVVDAIRWVLGEQKTRMLRSDKMENVIFNGTKNRKPSNLAEVSLTFENTKNLLPTEYTHVTITRRYYRSGESEYQINGVTCRLKDITNLFMDTGINSNSYAIIELKMIDELLNDKNNSRRELFEEAAGISKFKTRKKETLRKLEDTDADLARVEDLLYEIEKNLKSLEKQAKQAAKYFEIKAEYKSASINLAKKSIEKYSKSLIETNQKIQAESDRKLSFQTQIADQEAMLSQLKADLISKEKLLASRQKTLNEHVNKIRSFESEKKIKNERLRFLEDRSQKLREQIDADRKSNDRAGFSIRSLQQEMESAGKMLAEKEAVVSELRAAYESQKEIQAEKQLQQKSQQQAFEGLKERVYQLSKDLEIKQIQLSTLKQELERTSSDDSHQEASLVDFEAKIVDLKEELDQATAEFTSLKNKQEDLDQKIEESNRVIEMIREELTTSSRKLDSKQNEYNLTKSLVENLEGFPEAIKFLKKNSSWGKDIPLLSDLLTTDEKYRVTIENYLEGYMNYYVVDTEAQAIAAIQLLSDASRGKANFFVLEHFERFKSSQSKLFTNAIAATEIIEFDVKYSRLINFILDNVYIVQGDYKDFPQDTEAVFISESGKYTKRKFSLSGGSVGLFEGKRIGRAKNLEKLDKEIKELNKKVSATRSNLDQKLSDLMKLKEISYKKQLEEKQAAINEINQSYVSVRTKKEQLAELLSSNANKREDILDRIAELEESLSTIQPDLLEQRGEYESAAQDLEMLTEDLEKESSLLSEKSQAFNQENILYHQQLNRVNSLEQEIEFKQNAYESSKERIEKSQAELASLDSEIKGLLENNEIKDDELIELYSEKEGIEAGVTEAEKDYYGSRGLIDETDQKIRSLQKAKESHDQLLHELQNSINEIKLKMTSMKERLSVEFELDLDQLMEENPELDEEFADFSEEDLRSLVQKHKEKLEKIGPINPMAMEAYDEIKERHDFIITQKDDLVKAKESLLTTIQEIDDVAKETFLEAFDKIKENFIKVFRSLFTEQDDCDLKLTDPDNPLESSIEIMAKPKGKRPLTINQLSGGEKTLTATSLLFSIYLLKPAPFCIFDEVDAPLDDANIDKFNQIIQQFSGESQFIIVTHNKRTMASTDIIYGITMIEAGVSRVVPVDLRELA
ncbi:MAG: chromosome segregation protein SMC [Algoriphagus sp.]|jgi:chromosome segregation protein|uniref:chromosome segregation protein SMC n=3 Tax=Algoriphagus TaxID=246875 RepID=UPI000C4340AD|nr:MULTISPECIES: chromosome segregation protein SMC [unclassified Algoriphagus]MAL12701.1 chromosome segregation protein SMC [Algoriphagus sp.]MAN85362.1 chromosome segregation protein SMC [Algoriphagus sp.]QYH38479.1 chromosome segregation protein SMC [Algoriphagus sp. NBT04N3]